MADIKIDGEYFRSCDGCRIYFEASYVGATCPCCDAKATAHRKEEDRQELSDRLHSAEGEIHRLRASGLLKGGF